MRAHGLAYGESVFELLKHYQEILPKNHAEFMDHYERVIMDLVSFSLDFLRGQSVTFLTHEACCPQVYPLKSKYGNPNYGAGWYYVNRHW